MSDTDIRKGDAPGHPFHGNQFIAGTVGERVRGRDVGPDAPAGTITKLHGQKGVAGSRMVTVLWDDHPRYGPSHESRKRPDTLVPHVDDVRKATAQLLGTLVPGSSEEVRDDYDVVEAALTVDQKQMLLNRGLWIDDILAGRVPGLDPDEIIAKVRADNA